MAGTNFLQFFDLHKKALTFASTKSISILCRYVLFGLICMKIFSIYSKVLSCIYCVKESNKGSLIVFFNVIHFHKKKYHMSVCASISLKFYLFLTILQNRCNCRSFGGIHFANQLLLGCHPTVSALTPFWYLFVKTMECLHVCLRGDSLRPSLIYQFSLACMTMLAYKMVSFGLQESLLLVLILTHAHL